MIRPKFVVLLTAFALSLALTNASTAQRFNDASAADSNWGTAGNWEGGSVPAGGAVVIGDAGDAGAMTPVSPLTPVTAVINSAQPDIGDLRIGTGVDGGGSGTVNQTSGSLAAQGWAFVGLDGVSGNNVETYKFRRCCH